MAFYDMQTPHIILLTTSHQRRPIFAIPSRISQFYRQIIPSLSAPNMLLQIALLWMAVRVVAITFPATVEVDLIFPRNETYAPSAKLPIVFAFQNSALVPSLDPKIDITIWNLNTDTAQTLSVALDHANFSGSDPLFVYTTAANLTASKYRLVWGWAHGNCSSSVNPSTGPTFDNDSDYVLFTIQSNAQQPDFAAGVSSACSNFTHFAYNLTGTMDAAPNHYDGRNSCAILSDVQPVVSGNPCAVQVSAQAASSISSVINGPTPTQTGKHSAASGWRVWVAGTFGLAGLVAAMVAL